MKKHKKSIKKQDLRWLNLASVLCFLLPVLFVITLCIVMMRSGLSYETIIVKNPILTIGFIISLLNIFIGYILRKTRIQIKEKRNLESNKLVLCIFAATLFISFNYPASVLLLLSFFKLKKYETDGRFIAWGDIKKQDYTKICGITTLCVICLLVSFWFMNAFA